MTRDSWKVLAAVLVVSALVYGGVGASPLFIADEGSTLAKETTLNFTGTGVSCVDNSGSARTDCTINATPPVPTSSTSRWYYAWVRGWGASFPGAAPSWYPVAPNGTTISNGCGATAVVQLGSSPTQRTGGRCRSVTGSGVGARVYANYAEWDTAHGIYGCFYAAFPQTTWTSRIWVAFSSSAGSMYTSNTPVYSYVGFRFASNVSATNWYACQDTASGSPNCVDTGATYDSSVHLFCIDCTGSSCIMTIDGLYSTDLGATKKPTAGLGPGVEATNGSSDGGVADVELYFATFSTY